MYQARLLEEELIGRYSITNKPKMSFFLKPIRDVMGGSQAGIQWAHKIPDKIKSTNKNIVSWWDINIHYNSFIDQLSTF